METKTLLILITVVVVYVLIGGAVLYGIEHTNELQTQTTASATYFNFSGGNNLFRGIFLHFSPQITEGQNYEICMKKVV